MPTIVSYVGNGNDDAFGTDGYVDSAQIVVKIYSQLPPTHTYSGGFHFPHVPPPQGAVIQSAKLRLFVTYTDDVNCKIYGNNVDNAEDFVSNPSIVNRPRTSASVSLVQDSIGPYRWIEISGLESIIQEIVNRNGWVSGNALALLLIANKDVKKLCEFFSYEQDASYAAQLEITYTTGVTHNLSIQVNDENMGYTTPAAGTYVYDEDVTVDVQATTTNPLYYRFDHWELDGVDVGDTNPYPVNMDADHVILAVFVAEPSPPAEVGLPEIVAGGLAAADAVLVAIYLATVFGLI